MLKHVSPLRRTKNTSMVVLPSADSLVLPTRRSAQISQAKHVHTLSIDTNSTIPSKPGVRLPIMSPNEGPPFNERGVDCDGLVASPTPTQASLGGDIECVPTSSWGIGPVITTGRAIVRRGLSFTLKKDPTGTSIRSVKSDGQMPSSKQIKSKLDVPNRTGSLSGLRSEELSLVETKQHLTNDLQNIPDCDPLKSLLQMPGIHAEVRLPDTAITSSPTILNPDTMSLTSADSLATSSSGRTSSRSWNSFATTSTSSQSSTASSNSSTEGSSTTIRVFARCLRSDIEYKTVSVGPRTTCGELVATLLSKYRMKHRDPNLFYLTMEVTVKRLSGPAFRSLLVLEESARPGQLALCRPLADARFTLQMRKGGVIKVHDTVLMPGSQYKSLLVSYRTTAEEVVQLMLNCCNHADSRQYYALHQVCKCPEYSDVRLEPSDRPLEVKAGWPVDRKTEYVFVLRRNMNPALSLRKLADTADSINNEEIKTSTKLFLKYEERSYAHATARTRCRSVPSPPARSRENISNINGALLDNSLRGSETTANSFPMHQGINIPSDLLGHSTTNGASHHLQDDVPTLIDCTLATPVMTRLTPTPYRQNRSHSASRVQVSSSLSFRKELNSPDHLLDYLPTPEITKSITWIEKTWTTTGCQTVLSCTSRPCDTSKSVTDSASKPKSSHSKHVNFADEPQIEGNQGKIKSIIKNSLLNNRKQEESSRKRDASSSPEISSCSSECSEPPPLPSVPPPPKIISEDVILDSEPPPLPSTSPPPLTPDPPRKIKPCIKYPKIADRSHSAPSSPAPAPKMTSPPHQTDRGASPVASPPPLPPAPPALHCSDSVCPTKCRLLNATSATDDAKMLQQRRDHGATDHNCNKNCFYI